MKTPKKRLSPVGLKATQQRGHLPWILNSVWFSWQKVLGEGGEWREVTEESLAVSEQAPGMEESYMKTIQEERMKVTGGKNKKKVSHVEMGQMYHCSKS